MWKTKKDASRHEEAMAMIEKGIYVTPPMQEPLYRKERYLLAGIILGMIGLAFVLVFFMVPPHDREVPLFPGVVALFVGLGIIAFYGVLAKQEKQRRELEGTQNPARIAEAGAHTSNTL